MKKQLLLSIALLFTATLLHGQGIKGMITADGEPLPFATIYIEELGTGTSSNEEGYFEYRLAPGSYRLLFRYLGYQTETKRVEIKDSFEELNINLKTNIIQLSEVEVKSGREDPAYTIIRKAIAKSKYHTLQLDAYTAQVYIKGAGKLNKIPFYLKKAMKKEGVDTSTVFLQESISNIKYTRPDTYEEEVISIRQIGNDNSASPNSFIQGSFYESELGGAISPLSPRAFMYYRFKYEGSFFDGDYEINKISVIPRVRGEDVFTGKLYIVEDLWSIHSVDFLTYKFGFKFDIKQIYTPVEENVWLPISHKFKIEGGVLGIAIVYDYLATLSKYDITLNSDLEVEELVVIDEKIEKEIAKELKAESALPTEAEVEEIFDDKQKFTRKQLRKTLKKYEQEMLEEAEEYEPDTAQYNFKRIKIDSTAYTKDSAYWATARPIPLTNAEKKSYVKLDSMAIAEKEKREKVKSDSTKRKKKGGFDLDALLFGKTFKLGKHAKLQYRSPLTTLQFNTVEGYYGELPIQLTVQKSRFANRFTMGTRLRYGFAGEQLYARGGMGYEYNRRGNKGTLKLEGGRYVQQFSQNSISPFINTLWSLLGERNYLKLFEKDYLRISLDQKLGNAFSFSTNVEYAQRTQLFNNTDHSLLDVDERQYSSNAPFNRELMDTSFPTHDAFLVGLQAEIKPIVKYRYINGKKQAYSSESPTIRLKYNKGIPSVGDAVVDFDHLELGLQHQMNVWARGRLDFNVYAGWFPNRENLYFMDFQHFPGNRTFLQTSDPVQSYRLLDYYAFSTTERYVAGHAYYQFRKFLLTQLFEVRIAGLKENIIFNYLNTENSNNYMEVGYSLDNIFRFFRIEAIASFEDAQYVDWGIRVGISTNIGDFVTFE